MLILKDKCVRAAKAGCVHLRPRSDEKADFLMGEGRCPDRRFIARRPDRPSWNFGPRGEDKRCRESKGGRGKILLKNTRIHLHSRAVQERVRTALAVGMSGRKTVMSGHVHAGVMVMPLMDAGRVHVHLGRRCVRRMTLPRRSTENGAANQPRADERGKDAEQEDAKLNHHG